MKKILLFAGMAALMASCANQESVEMAQSNAIGFNTYVGKATRADLTAATLESFDVYGYFGTSTIVFDGEKVTKSGDTWVTDEPAYWIPNKVYNFAAVAPSSTDATFDANGLVLTDYTPSGDDLIVAITNPITAKSSDNDEVQLQFKHALAKVQINLKKLEGQEFSDVKLNGVINKGTLTTRYSAGAVLSWEPSSETTDYTFTDNSDALYLIPQELTNDVKVTLTADGIAKDYVVKTENVGKWETGHVYTYLIDLTSDLEEIQIVVGDMDDYNDQSPETDDPTEPEPEDPEEPSEDLLTNDVKIDFGSFNEDNPDISWNKLSDLNPSNVELKDINGSVTSLKLTSEGFSSVYAGAGSEPQALTSNGIEWPIGVWKDSYVIDGSNNAKVIITGLNNDQKFKVTVLSARFNGGKDARKTKIEINSESIEINQGIKLDSSNYLNWESVPYDNFSHVFDNVTPSEEGSITISVSGTEGLTSTEGHFSAMVISPVED